MSSFNRQGLEPIQPSPALALGAILHKTLEAWTLRPDIDPESVLMELANAEIDRIRVDYREHVGASVGEDEMQAVYDALHMGLTMVRRYALKWGSPTPDGYRLIKTEQTLLYPIPGTAHWECENGHIVDSALEPLHVIERGIPCMIVDCNLRMTWQPDMLEGTLDGLLESVATGWLFILERKSYGNRPNLAKLQMEDQFLAYYWLLRRLFPDRKIGGVLYDGMWKRDGSGRVDKDIDQCFMRTVIDRTDAEIEEFEQHLMREALDMHNPSLYINRPWQGCFDCRFERLCTSMSRGEDSDYVRDAYYKPRTSGVRVKLDDE